MYRSREYQIPLQYLVHLPMEYAVISQAVVLPLIASHDFAQKGLPTGLTTSYKIMFQISKGSLSNELMKCETST